ncbi:protein ZBED8-like [Penaeus monodon]|uniref:protein ZBED8-like n=1 Tax=Penaeus monodon TaxID=6687 RepID=UPI0018A77965|nr:protein ZBED8-like [Penaeus monodon]
MVTFVVTVTQNDRAVCALCCEDVVCRTSSVKRHFETKHEKTFKDCSDKAEAINKAVSRYANQISVFKKPSASKINVTEASYKLALCIAKNGKPFTDGDLIKAAFLECSEVLFDGLSNKHMIISRIKDLPVSARTVERRISEMAANVSEQQTVAITTTPVFSVALGESVDVSGIPRLAVFARYSDAEIHEELCYLKPVYGTTKGEDILKTFIDHFEDRGVDIRKIFAVTTDGAHVMIGKNKGFTKMIEDKIGHPILKLHCIIHQESVWDKISSSDLNKVMATVAKVVNFLVVHSPLTHRQLQAFLQEVDSVYRDIPLHSRVKWLSCGKVLARFVECFDEIKIFLSEKGQDYPELEDRDWTVKLMFLSDITKHLHDFSLLLQDAGKTVIHLYDTWKAFVAKLAVYSSDIKTGSFRYFKNLKNFSAVHPVNTTDLQLYMQELNSEFTFRFQEFQHIGPWASSLWSAKFKDLREILETNANDHAASILSCWTSLPDKFNCMKRVAFALLSAFGSTYQCEQILSHTKHIPNPHRRKLTTDHYEGCVKLKMSRYSPDISTLAEEKQGLYTVEQITPDMQGSKTMTLIINWHTMFKRSPTPCADISTNRNEAFVYRDSAFCSIMSFLDEYGAVYYQSFKSTLGPYVLSVYQKPKKSNFVAYTLQKRFN